MHRLCAVELLVPAVYDVLDLHLHLAGRGQRGLALAALRKHRALVLRALQPALPPPRLALGHQPLRVVLLLRLLELLVGCLAVVFDGVLVFRPACLAREVDIDHALVSRPFASEVLHLLDLAEDLVDLGQRRLLHLQMHLFLAHRGLLAVLGSVLQGAGLGRIGLGLAAAVGEASLGLLHFREGEGAVLREGCEREAAVLEDAEQLEVIAEVWRGSHQHVLLCVQAVGHLGIVVEG